MRVLGIVTLVLFFSLTACGGLSTEIKLTPAESFKARAAYEQLRNAEITLKNAQDDWNSMKGILQANYLEDRYVYSSGAKSGIAHKEWEKGFKFTEDFRAIKLLEKGEYEGYTTLSGTISGGVICCQNTHYCGGC